MTLNDLLALVERLPFALVLRVLAPFALVIGGLVVGRVLGALLSRLIGGIGENRLAAAERALAGIGIDRPLPQLAERIAFWVTVLLSVSQAASIAQLGLLTEMFDSAVRITPVIALGVGIIFAGALVGDRLGGVVGTVAERSGAMPGGLAAVLVRVVGVVGASIVAFDTMGLATVLPVTVVSLLVAALLALLASAAVLASRGLLSNIAAARYVEETFIEGDRVVFRQEPAEVQSIGILATELLTDSGTILRVPNQLFVQEAA